VDYLTTPNKVQELQAALHAKAKGSPDFRFYSLYDKVYRLDVLRNAYKRCKSNGGAHGVDGQTFKDIKEYDETKWLGELAAHLKEKKYRPEAVRRVYIPKANGKQRPLGIPTIRDRVVQTAAMIVLEPIFEADFPNEQYGYRPRRSGLDAVQKIHGLLCRGHREVVDADLSGYFDTIPHAELMKSIARRVVDRQMLSLIKSWLEAPVEDEDDRGRKQRKTPNKDAKKGSPQGSPISPLLSNVYMRRFILAWKRNGLEKRLGAHIVNYADDFVICCRGSAEDAMGYMRQIMDVLKLTVNEEKTRICHVPDDQVEFLGYAIGRCFSPKDGHEFIGTRPTRKAVSKILEGIKEQTESRWTFLAEEELVRRINRQVLGWWNYFQLDSTGHASKKVDGYARARIRQWLRRKHKLSGRGLERYPAKVLYKDMGLVQLQWLPRNFSRAKV